MNRPKTDSNNWAATTITNTVRVWWWTAAWVATLAMASFGPKLIWESNKLLSWIIVLVNLAVGAGMIAAYKRHLNGIDEMQRKIELDAMALSLGVGMVVGLAYSNLDIINLIPFDAEIGHLVLLMGLTYITAVLVGYRRYR